MEINGINVLGGFALKSSQPLDARSVVDQYEDLAWLISSGNAYQGMIVYVNSTEENKGLYICESIANTGTWKRIALTITDKSSDDTDDLVYAVTNLVEGDTNGHSITATYTGLPTKTYVDKVATGHVKYLGTVSALSSLATNAGQGDFYRVSTSFTFGSETAHVGDIVLATKDNPAQDVTDWDLIHAEIDANTWVENKVNAAGYVTAPGTDNANKVWKTDENGNPDWRDDADTTYESKEAAENGTAVSLVTTGEKYIWNTHSSSTHAPSDAEKNVQSDWNVADDSSDAFIKNKPTIPTKSSWNYDDSYVKYTAAQNLTSDQKSQARSNIGAGTSNFSGSYTDLTNKPDIPTVNNGTLTIQKNGTTVETFTANQSSNTTANIIVPTKTSDLTNDSGFLTSSTTTRDIEVNLGSGTLGGYKTGDTITANTSLDTILTMLLQKAIPATYTTPTLLLSNNGGKSAGSYEVGTSIKPKLKAIFTKNHAGNLTSINIEKTIVNDETTTTSVVADGTYSELSYDEEEFPLGDETITYVANATHEPAPVLQNNLGQDSTENRFTTTSVKSNEYKIVGKRQLFYFTGTGALPDLTSSFIRGTDNVNAKLLGPYEGYKFPIKLEKGQQYIVIAYPNKLRNVNKIRYNEANDDNMAQNFTLSTVDVSDIRGKNQQTGELYNPQTYKVYTYALLGSAEADMNFEITI